MKNAILRLFLFAASVPIILIAWFMICVGERTDFGHGKGREVSEK